MIVQANVKCLFSISNMFYTFLEQECPNVVLLKSIISNWYKIRHYSYTSRQTGDGLHMGSYILIKSTNTSEFLTLPFTHPDFMAVRIFTPQGHIILPTAYIRALTNLPLADFKKLFNYPNPPVFFARDINTTHTTLHHSSTNAHGRQLLSIFETKRLVFGNKAALAYHTHLQPGLNVGSDHIPVVIKISISPILNKERRSFRYKQADLELFKSKSSQQNFQFNRDGLDSQTIDGHWNFIFASIASTMLSTISLSQYKTRISFQPSERTIK